MRRTVSPERYRAATPEVKKSHHDWTKSTLERVGEALGLDGDDHKEYGDGWKMFKAGVYTYPISFAIPITSSPTINCEHGTVVWRLRAQVHRPGAFKSKLVAAQEIVVVAGPGEDDTDDTENIIVERQWDDQMLYHIVISGRTFTLGGTLPITVTFMPWTKMRVLRISVVIEERIDYLAQFKRIARSDSLTRVALLAVAGPKDAPILPLLTDDADGFQNSPNFELAEPGDDLSELASSFMGPGPWSFHRELPIPQGSELLHFSNRNRRSNLTVTHVLKVTFRVQRGDDRDVDRNTGKRKMYDIVVQTPVHLLSHLCGPEYTALPPYSQDVPLAPPMARNASGSQSSSRTRTHRHVSEGHLSQGLMPLLATASFVTAPHTISTTTSASTASTTTAPTATTPTLTSPHGYTYHHSARSRSRPANRGQSRHSVASISSLDDVMARYDHEHVRGPRLEPVLSMDLEEQQTMSPDGMSPLDPPPPAYESAPSTPVPPPASVRSH